jgi:exosortase
MSLIYLYVYMFIVLFVGLWPFNFWQTNKVTIRAVEGIILNPPATTYTKIPAKKLSHLKEFTIVLDVRPKREPTDGYARILTYSLTGDEINFGVTQERDSLVFILKADNKRKLIYLEEEGILKNEYRSRLGIVYGSGRLKLYKDGTKVRELYTGHIEFSTWNNTYPLVIGSDADGNYCWRGSISMVSIFDRTLSGQEIQTLPAGVEGRPPIIHYVFGDTMPPPLFDRGSGEPANLSIPHHFTPYKRKILDFPRLDVQFFRDHLKDTLVNVVGLIPLGFLLAGYLNRRRVFLKKTLLVSAILGIGLSIVIEFLQAFLPTRNSNMFNVIMNGIGTILGAFIQIGTHSQRTQESDLVRGEGRGMTDLAGQPSHLFRRITNETGTDLMGRHTLFLFLTFICIAMIYDPLQAHIRGYTGDDSHAYIILIPFISAYLVYEKRAEISSVSPTYSLITGMPPLLMALALFLYIMHSKLAFSSRDYASAVTFSGVIFWIGSFLLIYGVSIFRTIWFPFLFLTFLIPLPTSILNGMVAALLYGSTVLVDALFRVTGIPFVREGFVFRLPGVAIEIADQCSGINSSFALFIIGILATHLFVKTKWKKAVAIASIIPIAMVKNAVRIVSLSILAVYVDEQILIDGFLHRSGGFVFYVPALALILTITWLLGRTKRVK